MIGKVDMDGIWTPNITTNEISLSTFPGVLTFVPAHWPVSCLTKRLLFHICVHSIPASEFLSSIGHLRIFTALDSSLSAWKSRVSCPEDPFKIRVSIVRTFHCNSFANFSFHFQKIISLMTVLFVILFINVFRLCQKLLSLYILYSDTYFWLFCIWFRVKRFYLPKLLTLR